MCLIQGKYHLVVIPVMMFGMRSLQLNKVGQNLHVQTKIKGHDCLAPKPKEPDPQWIVR